jgi:hypothetical protein
MQKMTSFDGRHSPMILKEFLGKRIAVQIKCRAFQIAVTLQLEVLAK